MPNNFEKIENYLLKTFDKREGRFGYKPRMHPNGFSEGENAHQQLLSEGLIYLENKSKEAIASIHPKRGITFNAVDSIRTEEEEACIWKITIKKDGRVRGRIIKPTVTNKGVAVLGELDLSEIEENDYDEIIHFCTQDKKLWVKMDSGRTYLRTIYTEIISVE